MTNLAIFQLAKNRKYDSVSPATPFMKKNSKKFSGCGDWGEITISQIDPVLKGIQFSHRGCLLSRVVIISLIEAVEGKSKDDALKIVYEFRLMIVRPSFTPNLPENLLLLSKFSKFLSRRSCLLMGCNLLLKVLNESE